jgi:hypothetical protein
VVAVVIIVTGLSLALATWVVGLAADPGRVRPLHRFRRNPFFLSFFACCGALID